MSFSLSKSAARCAAPRARPARGNAAPAAPKLVAKRCSTVARVTLTDDFKAILAGALEREAKQTVDRVGVPGLQLNQQLGAGLPIGCDKTGQIAFEADIQLAGFLKHDMADELAGKRVLELGSGTGLVGIVAATCGAQVTCTDLKQALPVASANVDLNINGGLIQPGAVAVEELDWAVEGSGGHLVSQSWDFIVGSDLVYEGHTPAQLATLLQRLMQASPSVRVLIAHRHRRAELDASMEGALQAAGMRLETLHRTAGETCEVEDVSVYNITRA